MSAYVVRNDAIDLLVTAAVAYDVSVWDTGTGTRTYASKMNPTDLGKVLLKRNIDSYLYRYSEHEDAARDVIESQQQFDAYAFEPVTFSPAAKVGFAQQTIRSCDNLGYQCCEDDKWETSAAKTWIEAIREAAIAAMPGMSDVHWNYTRGVEARTDAEEGARIYREMQARFRESQSTSGA